jgi:putative RNA 2'-phosphotransferase
MLTRILCLLLRHDPTSFQIVLDREGWTSLPQLVEAIRRNCPSLSALEEEDLRNLAANQTTDRFEINESRIRCKYGHSLPEISTAVAATPPAVLYHATSANLFQKIRSQGLTPQKRAHVHLTSDWSYALTIREIRTFFSAPGIILAIDTSRALANGLTFLEASDEVWLSTSLPPSVLSLVTVHRRTNEQMQTLPLDGTPGEPQPLDLSTD